MVGVSEEQEKATSDRKSKTEKDKGEHLCLEIVVT